MKHLIFILAAVLSALCAKAQEEITTESTRKDTIRLLTIGNSFSQDAVEQYLYELAKEVGIHMIIGNAYKGGQSLEQHWTDLTQEHDVYEYRKVINGVRYNTPHTLLSPIITDEQWDYISFQQASHYSGLTTTYEPFLSKLVQYTDSIKTGQDVRYGWHMTWAYAEDYTSKNFKPYDYSQHKMYTAIVNTIQNVLPAVGIKRVIPSGTAIQLARYRLGDTLNRDGYHLSLTIGRYTAACTWCEFLTGRIVDGNKYWPSTITEEEAQICQLAAHEAMFMQQQGKYLSF